MKKLYAKQFNDVFDTNIYFDFVEEAKNLKFAINCGDCFTPYSFNEFNRIENEFSYFLQEYGKILNNDYYKNYNNLTELVNDLFYRDNGKKYNTHEVNKFKKLYYKVFEDRTYNFLDYVCEILEIMTGEKYEKTAIRGCSQGDYAEVIHPQLDREIIKYIEICYFGTGTEFGLYFANDNEEITAENCNDFDFNDDFIYYDYWNAEEFKKHLSKVYGVEIDNITVFTITDTKIIKHYVYGEN